MRVPDGAEQNRTGRTSLDVDDGWPMRGLHTEEIGRRCRRGRQPSTGGGAGPDRRCVRPGTRIRPAHATTRVPCISGWMLQWNGYEPGFDGAVKVLVPGPAGSSNALPSSEVTV